jgi:hypothetical protein
MLVDGKLVDAEGGATFDVVDPATGVVLGGVADGSHADMARAVGGGGGGRGPPPPPPPRPCSPG